MTVKMCIKYPQQLREDGIGLIKRREMWNRRHAAVTKPQSPPKSTLVRRVGVVSQKQPYLINNNSEVAARVRAVVAGLSSAKEKSPEVGLVAKTKAELASVLAAASATSALAKWFEAQTKALEEKASSERALRLLQVEVLVGQKQLQKEQTAYYQKMNKSGAVMSLRRAPSFH